MKRTREDNTVSVIQRAVKYYRIPVTKGSVKETLKSNSYYPTFKSICDTLNEWKVENYPLKYEIEEIKTLTTPYLVHFNSGGGRLAFVSKTKNGKVTYYDSYSSKSETYLKEFLEKCSGAVILLNPDERSGETNFRTKWQDEFISNSILPAAILILLLFIIWAVINTFVSGGILIQKTLVLLLLTKTAGIALSVLLILHEFEVRLSLTDKLCHLNKATNCNTVLNDKASKIFGWIGWADAGFIYFTGCLLFLLLGYGAGDYSLMAILSAISIPYPLFSIYYQGLVLKKWCLLCLGVQLLLMTEFILLIPKFSDLILSFSACSSFILISLIAGIIYGLINMYFREKMSNEVHFYRYLGFKKNSDVLRALLLSQKQYIIPVTDTSLIFGSKDSQLKITAFLSLHCSHCSRAYNKVRDILRSELEIEVNVILIASDTDTLNTLIYLYRQNKGDEALDLLESWYNMDPYSRNKLSETYCVPEVTDLLEETMNENYRLSKDCNIPGTPTFFINGYKLPNQYDIDDIKYFSEVFTDKDIIMA